MPLVKPDGWEHPRKLAAESDRKLPRGSGWCAATLQSLLFVVIDFKNLYQAREFEYLSGRAAETKKRKCALKVPCNFQTFYQRSNARAINIFHVEHIHDHARLALRLQQIDEHFAHVRRVIERNVADHVHNRGCAGITCR